MFAHLVFSQLPERDVEILAEANRVRGNFVSKLFHDYLQGHNEVLILHLAKHRQLSQRVSVFLPQAVENAETQSESQHYNFSGPPHS